MYMISVICVIALDNIDLKGAKRLYTKVSWNGSRDGSLRTIQLCKKRALKRRMVMELRWKRRL